MQPASEAQLIHHFELSSRNSFCSTNHHRQVTIIDFLINCEGIYLLSNEALPVNPINWILKTSFALLCFALLNSNLRPFNIATTNATLAMSSPKPSVGVEESVTKSPKPESPQRDGASEPAEESSGRESGEASESPTDQNNAADKDAPHLPNEPTPDGPPLPSEPVPSGPPLPNEPAPQQEDDGWDCQWDPNTQAWFFVNRFTGQSQWDNPRVATSAAVPAAPGIPQPPASEKPAAGGYNPAIHGDYDPNAWYAKGSNEDNQTATTTAGIIDPAEMYASTATFNRFTGQFQAAGEGPERHSDEAKSKRQMNAFFDVEAAANAHDGRSLKAERSGKKPSKAELKQFKEKRRARKEEKRRAWLRD